MDGYCNIKVYCPETNSAVCQAANDSMGYWSDKTEEWVRGEDADHENIDSVPTYTKNNGQYVANNEVIGTYVVSTPGPTKVYNEKDGSYTIYDKDNNIIGYEGKRIYTIQEANQVSAPTGNRVSLKYK